MEKTLPHGMCENFMTPRLSLIHLHWARGSGISPQPRWAASCWISVCHRGPATGLAEATEVKSYPSKSKQGPFHWGSMNNPGGSTEAGSQGEEQETQLERQVEVRLKELRSWAKEPRPDAQTIGTTPSGWAILQAPGGITQPFLAVPNCVHRSLRKQQVFHGLEAV